MPKSQKNNPASTNGKTSSGNTIDLSALLAEISSRLVTAGSVPFAPVQPVENETSERMQILVFALDDTHYALEVDLVGEVVRQPDITPVPGLPGWVLGVTNLHGDIISVVDLMSFLTKNRNAIEAPTDMLVAQAGGQRIGLMVNDAELIYTFSVDKVLSPPFKVDPGLVAYLRGAIERDGEFIRLLDCERLLLGAQMQQFS